MKIKTQNPVKILNLFGFYLLLVVMTGCMPCNTYQITATLDRQTHLSKLSSASAVWFYNDHIYLAGDDVPWLYQLDQNYQITHRDRLSNIDSLVNGRTPGSIKADFESMEIFNLNGEDMALVVPSGSKEISRDTAYLVSLTGKKTVYKKNIRRLYNKIIQRAQIESRQLNLEGLAIDDKHVYLLQRGNVTRNFVVRIPRHEFFNYFRHNAILPDFKLYYFDLPKNQNVASGFSGACVAPDQSGLLFTASLENTESAQADGEVLGSYVGYIPFCKMSKGEFSLVRLSQNNQPVEKKLEGITIRKILGEGQFRAISVCDNDDGTSDILELTIDLN